MEYENTRKWLKIHDQVPVCISSFRVSESDHSSFFGNPFSVRTFFALLAIG